MAVLYTITIFSSFNLAYDKIQKLNIPIEDNIIVTIVIVVSVLNFFLVLLQAIIFTLQQNQNISNCSAYDDFII